MIDLSLLQDFITESGEHLEEMETSLLRLETQPDNKELLNNIFRAIHTIKGSAEYLGMERIAELSHKLENLLEIIRHGSRGPDQEIIDTLIDSRDRIARLVNDLEYEGSEKTEINDLLARIEVLDSPSPVLQDTEQDSLDNNLEDNSEKFPDLPELALEPEPIDEPCLSQELSGASDFILLDDETLLPELDYEEPEPKPEPVEKKYNNDIAQETEFYEEEYDDELFDIFIQHLKENLVALKAHLIGLSHSPAPLDIINKCLAVLSSLRSSANYMDYEKIIKIYDLWQEELEKAVNAIKNKETIKIAGPDGRVSDITSAADAFIEAVVKFFPRLKFSILQEAGVESQEHEKTHDSKTNDLLPDKEDFEDQDFDFDLDLEDKDFDFDLESNDDNDDNNDADLLLSEDDLILTGDDSILMDDPVCKTSEKSGSKADYQGLFDELDCFFSKSPVGISYKNAVSGFKQTSKIKKPQISQTVKPEKKTAPVSKTGNEKVIKQSIRVDAGKIDSLMNQVGELVVSRAWFSQLHVEMKGLQAHLQESMRGDQRVMKPVKALSFRISEAIVALGRVANDLQEGVMKVRMLPIAQLFNRYPRLVRDLIHDVNKQVKLEIIGEETELDKMVIEEIADPLVHIIRNAVDHGCEETGERYQAGKPEECTLCLRSYHESNHVVIEVSDDGRGIDPVKIKSAALEKGIAAQEELDRMTDRELVSLIMKPGFSTASKISRTSGRGVGMDVVKENIEKLNGTIEIDSRPGEGTRFRIKIPLTLAIIQALLVRVGMEIFTIPLTAVEETLRINKDEITTIENVECIYLRKSTLSLIRLAEIFNLRTADSDPERSFVVVVNTGMRRVGLVVDELIGQEETVIKPIVDYLQEKSGFSGATILGDGRISLILDVYELVNLSIGAQAKLKGYTEIPGETDIKNNALPGSAQWH